MALFQPSNITPSTFAGMGAGVIDANDNVSISWQVNGTSAMVGYSVSIYRNTSSSTLVHTFNSPNDFQPFYGTDAQGNPVFFILEPGVTWASAGLSNGNSYKIRITQNWKNNPSDSSETAKSVVQTSESIFITRAAPSVSVSPGSGTLTSVSQTFTGSYSQAQGDALSWVRWVLRNSAGEVLDDTGTIYTGVLSYTYDGFFSGETYSLQCTVQTSSGAEVSTINSYAVSYEEAEQTGGISLSCHPDDSVTLSWAAGADIPGVPSADDYGTLSGGVLHLAAERSIAWNTVNGSTMSFASPYCFAWRGRIGENVTETETVNSGTWELWKTYPQSQTTQVNHTMSTGAWSRNPSASTTATREITVAVPVTRPWESPYSRRSTSQAYIGTRLASQEYYYKNESPATLTLNYDIIRYRIPSGSVIYDAGTGEAHWYTLTDAHCEATLSADKRTISVTIYTNTADAYESNAYVIIEVMYAEYYKGTAYEDPASGDVGISGAEISYRDPRLTDATVSYSSYKNQFEIDAKSDVSGTYTVQVRYSHTVSPSNLYMAKWGGSLNIAGGKLTSASIVSTDATGGATVSANRNTSGQSVQNAYAVTEYNGNNTTATQTVVRLNYTIQVAGSDSYRSIVTVTHPGAQSASIQSTTAQRTTIDGGANGVYTVTMYASSDDPKTAVVAFNSSRAMEMEDILVLSDGTAEASLNVTGGDVVLSGGGTDAASIPVPVGGWYMLAVGRPGVLEVTFFNSSGGVLETDSETFSVSMPSPVSSVELNGEQWCEYVYISQNPSYSISPYAEPGWDNSTLFFAAFSRDLQAGTVGSGDSLSVAIYRREGTKLSPIGVFDSGVKSVRDYAIRSGEEYAYEMFYITSGTYSAGAESAPMCRRFRQHTLIEAEEDAENPGVYHPVNVWRFRDNVDAGAYTNQNQPVLLDNFTKYPLWQPSSPAAKSGTLTALLGWFEDGVYSGDTAAAMDKLFALSSSVNPLFYRDMKGNLYMVRLSGPISQTVDNRTGSLAVSVSVPWVEVGDAEDAKIYTVTEG